MTPFFPIFESEGVTLYLPITDNRDKQISQKHTSIYKPPFWKKCGHLFIKTASAVGLLIGWALFFATQVRGKNVS